MQPAPRTTAPPLMPITSANSPSAPPEPPSPSTPPKRPACPSCSRPLDPHLAAIDPQGAPTGTCWECRERDLRIATAQKAAADLLAELDHRTGLILQAKGVAPRELRADWAKVPTPIKAALPRELKAALAEGRTPEKGVGLGSATGTGKTMAVAAMIRRWARIQLEAYAGRVVEHARTKSTHLAPPDPEFRWACWPDTVAWLRSNATTDGPGYVDLLAHAPFLVLDDLGRERIKGTYVEDWAASQLDAIVSARYRHLRPTLWTTNLEEGQLVALYGAALVSRLTEDAPLVWIPNLPTLRL